MHARAAAATAAFALAAAAASMPAHAVITTVTDTGGLYSLTLRVGTAGATVDTVAFNVTGAAAQSPVPLTGSQTIDIWVQPIRPTLANTTARPVTLRVDSSTALSCPSGTCGGATIPFSKISWVATFNDNLASGDIQTGRFTGGGSQLIASYNANATFCSGLLCPLLGAWTYQSRQLTGTRLQFTYDNDVVYPAGNYKGTVRFTASME